MIFFLTLLTVNWLYFLLSQPRLSYIFSKFYAINFGHFTDLYLQKWLYRLCRAQCQLRVQAIQYLRIMERP